MLRKLLGKDVDAPSATEEVALVRLAAAHRKLVSEGGRLNTKSEAGFNACALFLEGLDAAAKAMRLDATPRSYRVAFTINYRALFPDEARNYRVDVLEASVEQYAVIWVNGDKFEFTAEAMRRAEALQKAWSELGALLDRWNRADQTRTGSPTAASTPQRPSRSELRNALVALDCTWASFEHKYIAELIEIEEKARRLVVQAIEHERCLQLLEAKHQNDMETLQAMPEYCEEFKKLVACIAHLNSVANFRRKGRDDLRVEVYFDAMTTLRRCDGAEQNGEGTDLFVAARTLARDVVDSFAAMREYLREVERCLERVDPHLCNNAGLVARLVDWEESWEVGTRYVQHENLLAAICDIVAELRVAQRLAPALAQMCEDCDVELFLVLPRIIWLRFLAKPLQHASLLKTILPHHFTAAQEGRYPGINDRLCDFLHKYEAAQRSIVAAQGLASFEREEAKRVAWELLVKRVVGGSSGKEDAFASLPAEARAAAEELMHDLERWSIELQRHCPEDWNQCSAILVQCLTGTGQKVKPGQFRV